MANGRKIVVLDLSIKHLVGVGGWPVVRSPAGVPLERKPQSCFKEGKKETHTHRRDTQTAVQIITHISCDTLWVSEYQHVISARRMFVEMCNFASGSSSSPAGTAAPSRAGSVFPLGSTTVGSDLATTVIAASGDLGTRSRRVSQFVSDAFRPNIHAAVHYTMFAHKYGLPVNVDMLSGENLHRSVMFRVSLKQFILFQY